MGSLKPHEEFHLFKTDYAAWCRYVAPKWKELLMKASADEKKRLWIIAKPELRAAVRALVDQAEGDISVNKRRVA